MRLFRPEALRGQDTLHGEVSLVPPVSWQLLSLFLFGSVLAGVIFVSLAGYAKVTVATGAVTGDKGVVRVAPSRSGTYDHILVGEGQVVSAGAPLAHVAIATVDEDGALQVRRSEALSRQKLMLSDRLAAIKRSGEERVASLRAQITGEQVQIRGLRDEADQEKALIRSAQDDLDKVQLLAQRGFISGHDLRLREEQVATRKQALSRLNEDLGSHEAAIQVARSDIARAQADGVGQAGEIAGMRAELDRAGAGDDLLSSVVLKAPVDGTVTAVTAHAGDPATPGTPALSILPRGTRVEATLAVPASAAGLLKVGQTVRIAVDAFPYQTFGTLTGEVKSVSRATTPLAGRSDGGEAFMVRTTLPATVLAYGAPNPLRPGMTLTVRIRTRPRSLLAWIFDPVLAVRRR